MMLDDLERGKGKLLIAQTDMEAFEVGRNTAISPGAVVWQNDLLQLIQYAPATEKVYASRCSSCRPGSTSTTSSTSTPRRAW